jgi:hypothetical protein
VNPTTKILQRTNGFPAASNITGKIGSHVCIPVTLVISGHEAFLSQRGFTVSIIELFEASRRHELRIKVLLLLNVGQPVSEREYTRGQISLSSDTPSWSVSVRARVPRKKTKEQKRREYFFIKP